MSITREAEAPSTPRALPLLAVSLVVLGVVILVAALTVTGGSYAPAAAGLPDPGPVVGWGLPIVRLLTDLAGAVTLGWLLAAAFLDPSGTRGVVSPEGRQDLLRATVTSGAWAVLALLQMFLALAQILGVPLDRAMSPDVAATYAWDIPLTRALALVAVLAAVIAIGCLFTATLGMTALWLVLAAAAVALPALASHGSGFGDHALALTSGVAHTVAAALWIGGLMALLFHGIRRDAGYAQGGPLRDAAARFGVTATVCVALLAVSGAANAYTRLDTVGQLLTTEYGRGVLTKILLILVLVGVAVLIRRSLRPSIADGSSRAFLGLAALEIVLLVCAFAVGVALAVSPYPRIESALPSYGESLLGYPYPPPPDVIGVAFGFRLEPLFLVGGITLAALYIAGVVTLLARGDRWPWGRTLSWLAGVAVLIWATNAGIAEYSRVSVGLHMVQHMTMAMLAPMLLVLGGPFTLALRALPAAKGPRWGLREWIVWGLHSPVAKVVTNPVFVFVIFSASMFALYFTPALSWFMGSHVGHVAMQLHFIGSGYLFAWVVMGVDPVPKPIPYWAKFGLILLMVGVHGLFAVIVMMGTTPLAQEWYGVVRPEWVVDPLTDTRYGGQVAWGISEIPMLFMVVMVAAQWARSDEREARRQDRQADRDGDAELTAYNEHLAALDQRSRRPD